jgi:hypothetical protein
VRVGAWLMSSTHPRPVPYVTNATIAGMELLGQPRRTSENSVKRKFNLSEFTFHALW